MDDDKGISLTIINSSLGESVFKTIENSVVYKNVDLQSSISYNPSYSKSVDIPKSREYFFNMLNNKGFETAYNKIFHLAKKHRIKTAFIHKLKRIIKLNNNT